MPRLATGPLPTSLTAEGLPTARFAHGFCRPVDCRPGDADLEAGLKTHVKILIWESRSLRLGFPHICPNFRAELGHRDRPQRWFVHPGRQLLPCNRGVDPSRLPKIEFACVSARNPMQCNAMND